MIEEEKQRHKEFVTDENTDEQAAPPVPLNKRKVLIIEDDNDVREFLKEEISHYFEVVAEADGISGFERAQTYDADLIICDVLMPGMTGFEVTKKLKNEFATSHIPIILLTALNMEEKISGRYRIRRGCLYHQTIQHLLITGQNLQTDRTAGQTA